MLHSIGSALALALAFFFGLSLGGSTPGWQMDRSNGDSPAGGGNGLWGWSNYGAGNNFSCSCLSGTGLLSTASAVLAVIFWLIAWPRGDGSSLLPAGLLPLLGAAALGYVVGIVMGSSGRA